jgi:hypothetical protein
MLDERWSEEVEEIGQALRKILRVLSTPERVRAAEASEDGRDRALDSALADFGLNDLEADAELFARLAWELGRSLAPTAYVQSIPVLAVLGRSGVGLSAGGLVPAALPEFALATSKGVCIGPTTGNARRTAAGDFLIEHATSGGELVGSAQDADRVLRFAALVDAAQLVGAGQALLEYGVNYAAERQQFGKIIGTYQGVAHRLARVSGGLDAAEMLVRKAAFTAGRALGGDGAPSQAFAWMVHAKAVTAARQAAVEVHQVFGGNGFAMEYDVQLYSRRIRSWALRGRRPGVALSDLARLVLDPARRDDIDMLWHYDKGMPLPRWALEADGSVSPNTFKEQR